MSNLACSHVLKESNEPGSVLGKIIVGSHVQEVIHSTEPWTDGRTWVLSRIWTPISGGALSLAFPTGFSASLPAHSTGCFHSRSVTPALAPLCLEPWKLTVNSGYRRGDLALRIWGLQHLAFEHAKLGILFAPRSPMIDAAGGCLVQRGQQRGIFKNTITHFSVYRYDRNQIRRNLWLLWINITIAINTYVLIYNWWRSRQ